MFFVGPNELIFETNETINFAPKIFKKICIFLLYDIDIYDTMEALEGKGLHNEKTYCRT